MSDAVFRLVFGPKRSEVNVKADFATAVHLDSLAVEFGQLEVHGGVGVCGGDLEAEVKLPLHQVVNDPALARPDRPFVVRLDFNPVVVLLLVLSDVVDQHGVFFF